MPPAKQNLRRYIIMSSEGFLNASLTAAPFAPSNKMIAVTPRAAAVSMPQMRVLDSLRENGPKLVEMPPEGELSLRLAMPGLKIVPEVFYHRQWERFRIHRRPSGRAGKSEKKIAKATVTASAFKVKVVDASSGAPVR